MVEVHINIKKSELSILGRCAPCMSILSKGSSHVSDRHEATNRPKDQDGLRRRTQTKRKMFLRLCYDIDGIRNDTILF